MDRVIVIRYRAMLKTGAVTGPPDSRGRLRISRPKNRFIASSPKGEV
jgi:hypothetical protein